MELQAPDGFGEHSSCDEVEHTGRGDQEILDGHIVASTVEEIADQKTREDTRDDREWEGSGRKTEGDTTDKDHGLETFSESGDEWEEEHGISSAPFTNS